MLTSADAIRYLIQAGHVDDALGYRLPSPAVAFCLIDVLSPYCRRLGWGMGDAGENSN